MAVQRRSAEVVAFWSSGNDRLCLVPLACRRRYRASNKELTLYLEESYVKRGRRESNPQPPDRQSSTTSVP